MSGSLTSGERAVFAASMAASADAGRDGTIAAKAAAMAVELMRSARLEATRARSEGSIDRSALTDDELAMLDDMLGVPR